MYHVRRMEKKAFSVKSGIHTLLANDKSGNMYTFRPSLNEILMDQGTLKKNNKNFGAN